MVNKTKAILVTIVALALVMSATTAMAKSTPFPKITPLPNGFAPEGIVSGYGTNFYVGSLVNGAIYKGDFRTGTGEILVAGQPGNIAVGLAFDERTGYLFVSGGPTGSASVYDSRTGEQVGFYNLTGSGSFINDVTVTQSAAYFTDSFNPRLFKLPLAPTGGLPEPSGVEVLALSGDWVQAGGFNANGIDASPNGNMLIVVNSGQGALYKVDPLTGVAALIDLDGASVSNGDGILLDGKTIYVLRNRLNQIAVIELVSDLSSGELMRSISDPAFDVPTTLTEFGSRLYAVNARFGTPVTPDTEYSVVQVSKR